MIVNLSLHLRRRLAEEMIPWEQHSERPEDPNESMATGLL